MIVMTPQASKADIDAVTKRLETTGVHVVVMPGELTTAIGAIGDPEGVAELGLEGMHGVDPEFVEADRIREETRCVRRYERSFMRPLFAGD